LNKWIFILFAVLVGGALLVSLPADAGEPDEHQVTVRARSFAFDPEVIVVSQGDLVKIALESLDVTHSMYIDGYDLELVSQPGQTVHLDFVADRVGKFTVRCNTACGMLHPFMIGELVVRPNSPYWGAIFLTLLAAVGSIGYLRLRTVGGPLATTGAPGDVGAKRVELTKIRWLKTLLLWRGFQPTLMLLTLFGFVLVIMTGLVGTPVGSKNFAIIYVWIVWFALLKIVLIPLFGRLWCTMCPIPGPGEWLQRRGIFTKSEAKPLTLAKKWPRKLDNVWLQNSGLLLVTAFSPIILTVPWVTGAILLAFIMLAFALSLVFARRTFCRYVCPVGAFIGLYSLVAPLELRVKDVEVCRNHREKDCYLGNDKGHGCPWMIRPWTLHRNAHCGLCTECLKTCPKDNVAVNLRPFGSDLFVESERNLGEAYTALIMLTSALLYSAIFLGPWGKLKDWAGVSSVSGRALYAVAFFAISLLVVPGLLLLAVAVSKKLGNVREVPLKQLFVKYSYALVPLGLSMWIAFSFTFILVNGSYAISVLSDPFGWGWDLFGTRSYPWAPMWIEALPYVQVIALVTGLVYSIFVTYRLAREHSDNETQAIRGLFPLAAFLTAATVLFIRLYLG
jgi:polyferredoxin/heme/copper-type cytochrome/quinol oxidase subunit 2